MRLTISILCGLLAALFTPICLADVYTYTAYDAPHQIHDATLLEAATPADVWTVYTDGGVHPDVSGDGDFRSGTPGVGDSPWGIRLTAGFSDVIARALITDLIHRPLANPGDSIAIDFNNGLVDSGGLGVFLYPPDSQSGLQAAFTLFAGDQQYRRFDAENFNGTLTTGLDATTDPLNVKFTLLDDVGGYQMDVTRGASLLYSSGPQTLSLPDMNIASIEIESHVGNADPAYNIYFNNLTITAVPETSSAVLLPVAVATIGLSTWASRRVRNRLARRTASD